MIGHEAVGPDLELVALGAGTEQIEVEEVIGCGREDGLLRVAPLGDMVRHPFKDDTGDAGHSRRECGGLNEILGIKLGNEYTVTGFLGFLGFLVWQRRAGP